MNVFLPKTIWHCTDKKVNDPIFSVDSLKQLDEQNDSSMFATGGGDTNVRV